MTRTTASGRRSRGERTSALPAQAPGSTRTLLRADDGSLTRRTVLPGGLRVVTEAVPTVRSVSLGIWVGVGSRDETPSLAGATHYLEHLLFKGTRRRTALDISAEMEAVGGEMNAFTAREYTCYHARVRDTDLPLAVDVLCDMVGSSVVAAADVDSERDVVLEEIAMHRDEPSDAVHDLFTAKLWDASPLGRPVLGTVDSITGMSRAAVAGYYRRRYRPPNIVVAAAGNLEHSRVVRLVRKAFAAAAGSGWNGLERDDPPAPPRVGGRGVQPSAGTAMHSRRTEQANCVIGVPGLARTDDRRFTLGVLNAALGGSASSRLFQEVREKRGLAYSVYSYASQYADAGLLGVYVGCSPAKVEQVLELCREQLDVMASGGLSAPELARGKGQLRGGLVLGLEDTGSRMGRMGKAELVFGELPSVEDLLARIDAVTLDDVGALAAELLTVPPTLAVIGPFDDDSAFQRLVA